MRLQEYYEFQFSVIKLKVDSRSPFPYGIWYRLLAATGVSVVASDKFSHWRIRRITTGSQCPGRRVSRFEIIPAKRDAAWGAKALRNFGGTREAIRMRKRGRARPYLTIRRRDFYKHINSICLIHFHTGWRAQGARSIFVRAVGCCAGGRTRGAALPLWLACG